MAVKKMSLELKCQRKFFLTHPLPAEDHAIHITSVEAAAWASTEGLYW